MHGALASDRSDPGFAPEAFSAGHQRDLSESMIGLAHETFGMLRQRAPDLPEHARAAATTALASEKTLTDRLRSLEDRKLTGLRTRIHGDLHLGQVLFTGEDFIFIDFEGEPARTLAERREKHSPLRDVAGMVRSFHYAAYAALFRRAGSAGAQSGESQSLVPFANAWYRAASGEYLRAYFDTATASTANFLPADPGEREFVLNFWLLGKAIYELKYELNHRLDWVAIPLEGIDMLLRGLRHVSVGAKTDLGCTHIGGDRYEFLVWAPRAEKVEVHVVSPAERFIEMPPEARGYHRAVADGLKPGDRYFYRLNGVHRPARSRVAPSAGRSRAIGNPRSAIRLARFIVEGPAT